MKYVKCLFFVVLILSVYSCEKKTYGILKNNNTNIIEQYVDSDTIFHTSYLIISANECARNNYSLSGFVIGPLYVNIWPSFKEERCREIYSYKGKHIYLYTQISDILELPMGKRPIRYCEKDSNPSESDYSKAPIVNYFKKAWLISFSDNKILKKSNVEHMFLPEIKEEKIGEGTGF